MFFTLRKRILMEGGITQTAPSFEQTGLKTDNPANVASMARERKGRFKVLTSQ
jgi:hypothetical protein